ncbi:MBL fold metallo-hydrolase [Paucibacter sp. KCTC 42545]|uniref:MBL fold metallo-hydrolase n=1 Tax=Paucibacter sp. KCTC 42545 TaxID=1768242 RepID=UPI000733B96D|nr:MBL fold metallo-hydrolase [Paucibacter sp. KCTC 42545]ALT77473.1 MBL fold metallo-hydrolase [Paucibacter sp. KCTC 42545]
MRFCSLGSGSGGNATLVEASQGITSTQLLVDCGFSLRELTRRLQRAGSAPEALTAVFITHEHGDHIGCALRLCQQYRVPLWTSRGTWRAVGNPDFEPSLLHFARDGELIELGDLQLQPLAVPHDANEPLHLRCNDGAKHLGLLTDLGCPSSSVLAALQGLDAMLLECNHDEDLLKNSSYPANLKRRILGSHGHLSNAQSATLLQQCLHTGLQTVLAAHLSERNNRPELAAAALASVLGGTADEIPVADQKLGSDWFTID